MKKLVIQGISLLIIIACGWFIWDAKSGKTTVIGVLRTSGLLDEEKQRFDLGLADYQITDFGNYDNAYREEKIMGYYLLSDNVDKNLLGKCVKVTGLIPEQWQDKNMIRDAYNRSTIHNPKIKLTENNNCDPYGKDTVFDAEDEEEVALEGTVIYGKRPAPDIGYDYLLKLKKPIPDEFSQSDANFPEKLGLVDIMPINNNHWLFLENNINKEITVTGYLVWGYAESRFLQITSINN